MGLIRLIILGLVIWLLRRLVNNFKTRMNSHNSQEKTLENQSMVSCEHCAVHIPQKEAVQHSQLWFCTESHKNLYLENNPQG